MQDRYDVVIVGAGHAGAPAAIALRQHGFHGTIAIVGEEPDIPYERPLLSKEYLSGEKAFERILIRPAGFWEERKIVMLTGRGRHHSRCRSTPVTLAGTTTLDYGTMIWATGGHPRRLTCPGHDLAGVHSVRSRQDVDRLMAELAAAERVVVI